MFEQLTRRNYGRMSRKETYSTRIIGIKGWIKNTLKKRRSARGKKVEHNAERMIKQKRISVVGVGGAEARVGGGSKG